MVSLNERYKIKLLLYETHAILTSYSVLNATIIGTKYELAIKSYLLKCVFGCLQSEVVRQNKEIERDITIRLHYCVLQ